MTEVIANQATPNEEEPTISAGSRIRLAAVKLFTRQGYDSTSMKQLASELGMVPANLYNYYPSKQAILFDVIDSQLRALIDRESQIVAAAQGPAETIASLSRDLVIADLKDPSAAFIAYHGLNGLEGEYRDGVAELMATVRLTWQRTIERGVQQHVFETPDAKLAVLTVITLCSFVSSWFDPVGRYSVEDVADFTAESALRCLGCTTPVTAARI